IGSSIAMIDRHYGHLARDSHVRSPCSTRSRSKGPWTLRGRQTEPAQPRSATAIRSRIVEELTGAWTLGGRRGSFLSLPPTTKGADQQELPKLSDGLEPSTPSLLVRAPRPTRPVRVSHLAVLRTVERRLRAGSGRSKRRSRRAGPLRGIAARRMPRRRETRPSLRLLPAPVRAPTRSRP